MKRLFTLAIIAMIASLTFAQAPVTARKAAPKKLEHVMKASQVKAAMQAKSMEQARLDKMAAAQETGTSVLRKAVGKPNNVMMANSMSAVKTVANTKLTRVAPMQGHTVPGFKNKANVLSKTIMPQMTAGKLQFANTVAQKGRIAKKVAKTVAPTNLQPLYIGSGEKYTSSAGWVPVEDWSLSTASVESAGISIDYITDVLPAGLFSTPVPFYYEVVNGQLVCEPYVITTSQGYSVVALDYSDFAQHGTGAIVLDLDAQGNLSIAADRAEHVFGYYACDVDENGTIQAVVGAYLQCAALEYSNPNQGPVEYNDTVRISFSGEEASIVDYTADMGMFQMCGINGEGKEAYVAILADQVPGTYTFADVYSAYTRLYLSEDDYSGVACKDLQATVVQTGTGYHADIVYYGANQVVYLIDWTVGEPDDSQDTTPAGVTVTKDEHGIITSVVGGVQKNYTRLSGTAYYYSQQELAIMDQNGVLSIVEDGDDIYMYKPISMYTSDSWVKGTREGNYIKVPCKQPLTYSANYATTISLRYGLISAAGNIVADDSYTDNFIFEIKGDTIALLNTKTYDGKSDAYFMGAFWDDDDSSTGYGDTETVLYFDPTYVAPTKITPPAGLQTAEWYLNANSMSNTSSLPIKNSPVQVGFDGNDVYVQGMFSEIPEAWVKGTINDSIVEFEPFQYIADYSVTNSIYFIGVEISADGTSAELITPTARFDKENNKITFDCDLLANAANDRVYYLAWISNAVVSSEQVQYEEPVITDLTSTLPYFNDFNTEDKQAQVALYDANEDGSTFRFAEPMSEDASPALRYAYNTKNVADDYAVMPGLKLKAGESYNISLDVRSYNDTYPERVEVVAGTTAKASQLTIPVVPATDVATATYENLSATFVPETDGTYYFAVHAISDPDKFYLYVDNFSVKSNDSSAPETVSDFAVVADSTAALKATISFTVPSTTISGESIDALVYTVSRNGEAIASAQAAAGSEVVVVDDSIPAMAYYVYSVVVTTVDGAHISDAVSAKVYVGEDVPDGVEYVDAFDFNNKLLVEWPAVVTGENGGIVIPEHITYNVYPVEMMEFWGMEFPSVDYENPYAIGVKGTSAELELNTDEGEQNITYVAVSALNGAGESEANMGAAITGAPYELPMHESFEDASLSYLWLGDCDDANYEADGGVGFVEGSSDNDGYCLVFQAMLPGECFLESGKVALAGSENPVLTFDAMAAPSAVLKVYAILPGISDMELVDTITMNGSENFSSYSVSLAKYASQPWIRFSIVGEFAEAGYVMIDNINVMNLVSDDLALTLSSPSKVVAGQSATLTAKVKNIGQNDAKGYVVKFYANDDEISSIAASEPLAFLAEEEFSATLPTSIFDEAAEIVVKAEVEFAADLNTENNVDETLIAIETPSATPVDSVKADIVDNALVVTWSVPDSYSSKPTVDDFESYDPVALVKNGETLGPWTGWDVDGGAMYGWQSGNWPGAGESAAFGIYNPEAIFGEAMEGGYNSAQCAIFMAVSPSSSPLKHNDDWMVSPELPGMSQTISFMLSELTADYGHEKYEVLVSSTDNKVESFTKIAEGTATETWQKIEVALPEGTKYFAIREISSDAFGMLVDDVTYTAGGSAPTGFNVYVDRSQIAAVDADARSYVYAGEVAPGEHEIAVTAVYGQTESVPTVAILSIADGIKEITFDKASAIYTVDGIRVAKPSKAGVYVVNGKKAVVK